MDGRHVAGCLRRWAHAPVIHAASHFYHEKRVAWVSISMHACDLVPIVMGLRLAAPWAARAPLLFISQVLFTECNDMSTARKDVIAYASIIDPALCDGVVVKLITTQSTEQVCRT